MSNRYTVRKSDVLGATLSGAGALASIIYFITSLV